MLITVSGKGGVGKTTITALIVDELLRRKYSGRMLVVDADPAQTLHLALGVPAPGATLARLRDDTPLNARTIRALPAGQSPGEYIKDRLVKDGVVVNRALRGRTFDMLAMGHGEGVGCYCAVNTALSQALESLLNNYDLIIVDSEAGTEHLSRYRIKTVDLFLIVTTPSRASLAVARQVEKLARQSGMSLGEVGVVVNRSPVGVGVDSLLAFVPNSDRLAVFDISGQAVVELPDHAGTRLALQPAIKRIETLNVRDLVPQTSPALLESR